MQHTALSGACMVKNYGMPCHVPATPCGCLHVHQIYPTKEFATFPDALAEVARQDVFQANLPSAAAFACAGPVASSKCEMTNLSWVIDGPYLSHTHGIRYTPCKTSATSELPWWQRFMLAI